MPYINAPTPELGYLTSVFILSTSKPLPLTQTLISLDFENQREGFLDFSINKRWRARSKLRIYGLVLLRRIQASC